MVLTQRTYTMSKINTVFINDDLQKVLMHEMIPYVSRLFLLQI